MVNIDVEGIDLDILKSFNFEKCRPVFFVVETAELTQGSFLGRKNNECRKFLEKKNYIVYADTYINTILIDQEVLEKLF